MTDKKTEALKLALETLEQWDDPFYKRGKAITTIREALAEQPASKPWVGLTSFDRTLLRTTYAPLKTLHHIKETDTDIVAEVVNDWEAFFTAIEAKLKEKNT